MDMRLPIKIHPDLQTIVHAAAEFQGRDPEDLVEDAVSRYLDEVPEVADDAAADWHLWDHKDAREYDRSLSHEVSARLVTRVRAENQKPNVKIRIDHQMVVDRALRHYFNALYR